MGVKTKKISSPRDEIEEKKPSNWQNSLLFATILSFALIAVFLAVYGSKKNVEAPKSEKVTMEDLMVKAQQSQVENPIKKCQKLRYWGVRK